MVNEADINLNGNSGVYWHNYPPNSQYFDVQSVVLHEFGHFLGLNHSNDGDAVMYNSISGGVIKRSLYYDDSNGIYSIYD
jgi:predicted Zn-dependent protease